MSTRAQPCLRLSPFKITTVGIAHLETSLQQIFRHQARTMASTALTRMACITRILRTSSLLGILGFIERVPFSYWSLALFYEYRAYNNSVFLDLCKQAYDRTYDSFITPSAAASGQGALRSGSFARRSSCSQSMHLDILSCQPTDLVQGLWPVVFFK